MRADRPAVPEEQPLAVPVEPARELEFVLQLSRFPWPDDDPAGWLTAVATTAAQVGFAGIALMDHLIQIPQVGRAWEPIPEPWVTLGLLAGLPTELRLGTLVSPLSLHTAGRLAKTAATLDALSGGRAFCGVGAGWWEREHLGFGLPFGTPRQRVDDLAAAIPVLRALWAPGTKPAAGLPETTSYPRPVGPLPVVVGGRGARVLAIAAESGDACNVPAEPAVVDRAVAADGVASGSRCSTCRCSAATASTRHSWSNGCAVALRPPAYARRHHAGTIAEHVARYRALGARGVDTVFVAFPDLSGPDEVERFAPVVAAFG